MMLQLLFLLSKVIETYTKVIDTSFCSSLTDIKMMFLFADDSLVQGTQVSDQTAVLSEEVNVEDVFYPTENGNGTIEEEETPVPEVVDEVPDDIHMVAESNSKIEEMPKKSYASIVISICYIYMCL